MPLIDMEHMIKLYSKSKRVSDKDFPAFRQKVLDGLNMLGLEKKKEVVECQNKVEK
jgi:hypothetical protein